MRVRTQSTDGTRSFVLVFTTEDEVMTGLTDFARDNGLYGAHFTALGALRDVTLGYWRWDVKDYDRIPVHEQVEVLSLVGNIARDVDGSPKVHAHIVVGKSDGTAHGGHLLEAYVRPTLEVVLHEEPEELRRRLDPETGLALLAV